MSSLSMISQCICLLIASYFTLATESRLLYNKQQKNDSAINNSKDWHEIAIKIAKCFLPNTCPLQQHLLICYNKHFENKRKSDIKKTEIIPLRRIFIKRNSEKNRSISEKAANKSFINNKNNPTRKLTPNIKNINHRIKLDKIQQ